VLLLLIGGFVAVMMTIQQNHVNQSSQQVLDGAFAELAETLAEQSEALTSLEEVLLRDTGLRDALRAQDRGRLLTNCEAIFAQLRNEYGITHFYFHQPSRVNLLRVHKPEKFGDMINRFTALEAERTGQTAWGIELGPLGTFTLRVVRPVFDGETLTGYLELGKEIEDVLEDISEIHGLELVVSIQKNVLDQPQWEGGMALLNREANWGRFPNDVLIYSSLPRFPSECDRFIDESGHTDRDVTTETAFNGKSWRVLISPLFDVSDTEVGDLIILHDISAAKAAFHQLLIISTGVALGLLSTLLGFLYILLRRTDQGIRQQQAELAESKDRFDQLAEQSDTFAWEVNTDGLYTYVSHVVEQVLGYRPEELVGRRHFYDLHPEDRREAFKTAAFEMFEQGEQFRGLENSIQTKDGRLVSVSTNGLPLLNADGTLRGYCGSDTDITERKQAEDKLQETLAEIERFNKLMFAREERVMEMKKEVNALLVELGRQPQYKSVNGQEQGEDPHS
jgi:PAS domain S-box-containing protein